MDTTLQMLPGVSGVHKPHSDIMIKYVNIMD